MSLRVLSIGALPPSAPYGASKESDAPFPEPSFTYPSGSPVKDPSLQVPLAELP